MIIWKPQPKQAEFMARPEYEALYGGAAGGGKSDALIIEALRQVDIPHYKALILRKTYPQLRELIEKTLNYYPRAYPFARYNASSHTWTFPSGAKIIFGSLNRPQDKIQYQGQAYDFIAFDELTHFTWDEYSYLFSRNRPNGAGTRVYIRATANPGGIGHGWVKERFISPAPPMTTMYDDIRWREPGGKEHAARQSRIFVPSSVFDNEALMKNDPMYVQRLASMPEAERKALLYGDWDSFSGQVFTEWRNDSGHLEDRRFTHVIKPFLIPPEWSVWRSMDWGYSRPFSVHWYAVDHDGRIYCVRELYGCTGSPNVGVRWEPTRLAEEILKIEGEDPNLKNRRIYGVADPAIFASSGAESIATLMERDRVYWEPGDHERILGKMQIHHRLSFDDTGIPMLYIFNTCTHMIRTLPSLVYSQTNVEDVDTAQEDHAYDELRYICMKNPITPRVYKEKKIPADDPLNLYAEEKYDKYAYYRNL